MSTADKIGYWLGENVLEWLFWDPNEFPLFWRRCFLVAFPITFPLWLLAAALGVVIMFAMILTLHPIGWMIDTWNGDDSESR